MVLEAVFEGAFVEMEAGLPLFAGFFESTFFVVVEDDGFVEGLKSSVTGGNAAPPLTALSFEGSAGFILLGSSSAPVTGLSGFAGETSLGLNAGFQCPSWPKLGSLIGVTTVLPAALSIAPSGTNLLPCSSLTIFLSSLSSPCPLVSLKLPRLNSALLCFSRPAMGLTGSTGTKLARTLFVDKYPFSLSLLRPLGERPRESGEFESSVALFSKMERRLRTADEESFSEDMAAIEINGSVQGYRFRLSRET